MKVLVILQGPAYGTEAAYNGLRLAGNLAKRDGVELRVFCFGDAVGCAVANQHLPDGYYHLDRMLTAAAHHGAEIGIAARVWTPVASPRRCWFRRPADRVSTESPTGSFGRTRR